MDAFHLLLDSPSLLETAQSLSGVIGSSFTLTPTALARALAMAAAVGILVASPTPLAPKGPNGSGTSTIIGVIFGISAAVNNL